VPGTDGEKMSKSYNNTLAVFDDVKAQRKQIMRITTDSRPMDQPKDPAGDVLFDLYKLVANEAQVTEMAGLYARGGFGYGDVKKALAEAAEAFFAEVRQRRSRWANQSDDVRDVLKAGAAKARAKAGATLARAQAACGIKGY
jgi:tryptophanyl-tRNA synthetase